MAIDLMVAIAVMTVVAVACGMFTAFYAYSRKGQRTVLCLTLAVFAMVYFLFYGSGQLFWAKFVPSSAAIIYTNFAAIFAALAAGWAWRLPNTPRWRRGSLTTLLTLSALAAINWPLLSIAVRPPPQGGDDWENGVAMQTSWATCSPAAAATLFRGEGIEVSEAEMIPLCLTDSSGTPTLGLYRGVKLISEQHDRTVEVLDETHAELLEKDDWPVLLAVELPFGVDDRRYADQWGWIPGLGHSVVAFGKRPDGSILIGDPSVGLEAWNEHDLQVLWHGGGMRVK
ncbi:peptidase C39, bacteriocin processing [Rhodopirellula maiorica SM1]|uniref:Peptidase C39, bacteriocin processing n=1 Tax=Rhodopirellula maiorica SM1 TaxID=1265738 RepID=M5RDI3_9BACT|nr:peptidase C39, bacteriocin processing [Rhodopirellula maiorica]EMI17440.1 peptidase C39, bacteriocin processing [Rhodopirellula maiorica SM1]